MNSAIEALCWHPDGQTLAVAGYDYGISFWDTATRKQWARLEGHKDVVYRMAFNHSGDLFASTSWDNTLRLWNPHTGQQLLQTRVFGAALRFSRDDRFLAAGIDGAGMQVWEVASRTYYRTPVSYSKPPMGYQLKTCPMSGRFAVKFGEGVMLMDHDRDGWPHSLCMLPVLPQDLTFDASGALLTGFRAGLTRWPIREDAAAGALIVGPPEHLPMQGLGQIAVSRDGRVLARAQGWGGLVWHQDRQGPPIRLPNHDDTRYIALSPNGRWVATGTHWGTAVKVCDADTGRLDRGLELGAGSLVEFSPDGRWLATSGGGWRLWAVPSWNQSLMVGGSGGAAFSTDGRLWAVGTGQGVLRLVNPLNGGEYARLEDPGLDRDAALTFSKDGSQLLAMCRESQCIHVWDLRAIRQELAKLGLDWDLPPYPARANDQDRKPMTVRVDLGNDENAARCNVEAWRLATAPDPKERDPKRAVELATKAVELTPRNGDHWNTLGVAQFRAGDLKAAVAALEKSMELRAGGDSFDWFFLAMARWRTGDQDQAREWYARAARWMEDKQPKNEELLRFRQEARELLELKN